MFKPRCGTQGWPAARCYALEQTDEVRFLHLELRTGSWGEEGCMMLSGDGMLCSPQHFLKFAALRRSLNEGVSWVAGRPPR